MRITLTVPKPCHEDWNAMTPGSAAGMTARFCDSCQHSVADLTRATDAELVALFTSDSRPKCARFDPRQLDRLLGAPEPSRSALPVAAFTSLLAVAAGQEAVAQGDVHVKGKPAIERPAPPNTLRMGKPRIDAPQAIDTAAAPIKMGEVAPVPRSIPPVIDQPIIGDTVMVEEALTGQAQVRPNCASVNGTYYYIDGVKVEVTQGTGIPRSAIEEVQVITGGVPGTYGDARGTGLFDLADDRVLIRGRAVDEGTGEALPFAVVRIAGTEHGTNTDVDGRFALNVPTELRSGPIAIEVRTVGYTTHRITDIPLGGPVMTSMCTDTVDVAHLPLSGRVVDATSGAVLRGATVEWLETGLHCCTDANGGFGFPAEADAKGAITLRITANGHAQQERRVDPDKLPFCVPIAMARSAGTTVARSVIDLGDLKLEQQHTAILGLVVAYKPTLWQRMKRPFRRW
jgi:hypothetical protein